MAASPSAEIQLTSEQRRRLGAVYQLILSWRRDDNSQKANPNEQADQTTIPQNKHEGIAHSLDDRGLP